MCIRDSGYKDMGLDDTYYWFGSDTLGRDIWTRVWSGTQVSLIIAVVATVINIIIGMVYGLISGYFGGAVDSIMQRIAEVFNGIPRLVIVILLLLVFEPGLVTIIIALILTEWIKMSRITRAEVLKFKEQEFVLASKTLGAKSMFIIFKNILPNMIGPVITQLMLSIPTAIFTEAFLSFVGLGIPQPMCLSLIHILVNGRRLVIAGGNYAVCPHSRKCCGQNCCRHDENGKICCRGEKPDGVCT